MESFISPDNGIWRNIITYMKFLTGFPNFRRFWYRCDVRLPTVTSVKSALPYRCENWFLLSKSRQRLSLFRHHYLRDTSKIWCKNFIFNFSNTGPQTAFRVDADFKLIEMLWMCYLQDGLPRCTLFFKIEIWVQVVSPRRIKYVKTPTNELCQLGRLKLAGSCHDTVRDGQYFFVLRGARTVLAFSRVMVWSVQNEAQ